MGLRDAFQVVQTSLILLLHKSTGHSTGKHSILLQQGNSPYALLEFFPSFGKPNPVLSTISGSDDHLLDSSVCMEEVQAPAVGAAGL